MTTKTYSQIARESNVSRSHVSRVMRGLSGVSRSVAKRIAQAYGVEYVELIRIIEQYVNDCNQHKGAGQ
jgi:transcriptional regulator with XRE-family HTH domain